MNGGKGEDLKLMEANFKKMIFLIFAFLFFFKLCMCDIYIYYLYAYNV